MITRLKQHRLFNWFLSSCLSLLCVYLLSLSNVWQQLENRAFDAQSRLINANINQTDIIIVAIDEQSFNHYQSPWPWALDFHSALLQRLNQAHAKAIVFSLPLRTLAGADETKRAHFANAISSSQIPVYFQHNASDAPSEAESFLLTYYRAAGVKIASFQFQHDHDGVVRRLPEGMLSVDADVNRDRAEQHSRIHFIGDANSFASVSYFKAANSNLLPEHIFKNKIVLVGFDLLVNTRFSDVTGERYRTPFTRYSGNTMSGVEVYAHALTNASNGLSIRPLKIWQSVLAALLIAVTASYLFSGASIKKSLLSLGKLLALICAISLFAFYFRIEIPIVSFLAVAVHCYLFYFIFGFRNEQKQRQFIANAFSRYVSNHVLRELIDNPDKLTLGGERKYLAILFADLAGFTQLSEQTDAQEVAAILHRLLTAHSQIIVKHGGTIDKYLGDAVMAFWGAPTACDRSVEKAVAAAIEMKKTCCQLTDELRKKGLPQLKLRIGVNFGEAIVGHLGSDILFDYTCIGDAVNQAARLESVNRLYGSDLLIGQAVFQTLDQPINFVLIDKVIFKGKSHATNIYCYFSDNRHSLALTRAFLAYCNRDWQTAHTNYQSLQSEPELTVLCQLFINRINLLKTQTLPSSWCGESYLDNK